jgi:predicted aspartyl protease
MRFAVRLLALSAAALLLGARAPLHLHGSVMRVVDGRRFEVTVDRLGPRLLVRRCSAGLCTGSWFDGSRRWSYGINEILVPDEGPSDESNDVVRAALAAAAPVGGTIVPPPGPQTTFSGEGTIALRDAPVPIVPCSVNGRAARCLLDTGSTPSAISLALAEALGLEPQGELVINAFGEYATGAVTAGPVTLGGARFDRVRLAVAPTTVTMPFDVVVGADLLARLRVEIDRAHAVARVGPPAREVRGGVPLHFRGGVPMLTVDLGGFATPALLDTGDSAIVSFGYDAYRSGPQWPIVGRVNANGIGGVDDALEVALPSAHLGALDLGPVRAIVRRTQHGAHVGAALWSRCTLTLDEAAERLWCGK